MQFVKCKDLKLLKFLELFIAVRNSKAQKQEISRAEGENKKLETQFCQKHRKYFVEIQRNEENCITDSNKKSNDIKKDLKYLNRIKGILGHQRTFPPEQTGKMLSTPENHYKRNKRGLSLVEIILRLILENMEGQLVGRG